MSISEKLVVANNGVPKVYDAGNTCTYTGDTYSTSKTICGTLDKPVGDIYIRSDDGCVKLPITFTFTKEDDTTIQRTATVTCTLEPGVETLVNVDLNTFEGNTVMTCVCKDLPSTSFQFKLAACIKKDCLPKNKPYLDTSKITNFSGFFTVNNGIENDLSLLPYLDTSNTTCFDNMFSNNKKLTSISDLDVSKANSVQYMFSECSYLTTVKNFHLGNVEKANYLFNRCVRLTSISNFSISANLYIFTFQGCSALKEISGVDTSNGVDFTFAFGYCTMLVTIHDTLDLSNGEDFDHMFDQCVKLENIRFKKESIKKSISFLQSTKLTTASLVSIVNGLCVNASDSKPTLTLSSASWDALENGTTPPKGYSAWQEYIVRYKNWLYA